MKLKSLAYTSRADPGLSERDVSDIHETARHLNALDGISGLLIFDGVHFLQIIEGGEQAIDHLVARLRGDGRHHDFQVRDERFVDARSFPDWSMALLRVDTGYRKAGKEIASKLPADIAPGVRELALRMAEELAADR